AGTMTVMAEGSRRVAVVGTLLEPSGAGGGPGGAARFSSGQRLEARSHNASGCNISGQMNSTSTSTSWPAGSRRPLWSAVSRSCFPYSVYDAYRQDNETMQIGPTRVDYSRQVGVSIRAARSRPHELQLSTGASAGALYKRSRANRSLFYRRNGEGRQWARLEAGGALRTPCMEAWVAAEQGATTSSLRAVGALRLGGVRRAVRLRARTSAASQTAGLAPQSPTSAPPAAVSSRWSPRPRRWRCRRGAARPGPGSRPGRPTEAARGGRCSCELRRGPQRHLGRPAPADAAR
ncbi:unnamed protein product, partial [Prorocentrum cordatum]